ncbi:MAG: CDP-glucose 4,6-dehydratase [Lachnospiraceae bacterium]|nr:CDP-glucose 4,6-dehydratase [Lachnospiraceae bacterium]
MKTLFEWYKNKRVLITGHTGFKGAWMCKFLIMAKANVTGYSLDVPTNPSLFEMCKFSNKINSVIGDIRDLSHLKKVFNDVQPEIVIHMAAQPLVRKSYQNPVYTYETNVMGTVNILECVRLSSSVKSFINVTTDKVYLNKEWEWGYRENEELNGYDPYSNSKSCSELVTSSYLNSFFREKNVAITTCRAGNVIGGGDFAMDRIIPDCVRSVELGKDILVRNPYSTRPYQHVLEPVVTYLMIAKAQYENKSLAGNYNIGPDDADCWSTGDLVDLFCKEWKKQTGYDIYWFNKYDGGPHEANFLKLDCSKLKANLNWKPVWNLPTTMEKIVEWSDCYLKHGDVGNCMEKQILEFYRPSENIWNN